ncbi:MAG: hypothetical protein QXT54_02915, partial [Thermoplasmatales archaeon]
SLDIVPVVLMLGAMGLAYYAYGRNSSIPQKTANGARDLYILVKNKFFIDVFYTNVIAERAVLGFSAALDGFEKRVLNGFIDLIGYFFANAGKVVRRIQTGLARQYALIVLVGLILTLILIRVLILLGVIQ